MINTCKILRVIAIRTYWAEHLIFLSKMRISAQYVRIVRIGHSYVLGSNIRPDVTFNDDILNDQYRFDTIPLT